MYALRDGLHIQVTLDVLKAFVPSRAILVRVGEKSTTVRVHSGARHMPVFTHRYRAH